MTRQNRIWIEDRAIENAFSLAGESLQTDISAVRFSAVLDVHYENIEVQLEIFGRGNPEEEAPVFSQSINKSTLSMLEEELKKKGAIGHAAVLSVLSPQLKGLLTGKWILVGWNVGWLSEMTINLKPPTEGGSLEIEPR